jgi:hypothetical protein
VNPWACTLTVRNWVSAAKLSKFSLKESGRLWLPRGLIEKDDKSGGGTVRDHERQEPPAEIHGEG